MILFLRLSRMSLRRHRRKCCQKCGFRKKDKRERLAVLSKQSGDSSAHYELTFKVLYFQKQLLIVFLEIALSKI